MPETLDWEQCQEGWQGVRKQEEDWGPLYVAGTTSSITEEPYFEKTHHVKIQDTEQRNLPHPHPSGDAFQSHSGIYALDRRRLTSQ